MRDLFKRLTLLIEWIAQQRDSCGFNAESATEYRLTGLDCRRGVSGVVAFGRAHKEATIVPQSTIEVASLRALHFGSLDVVGTTARCRCAHLTAAAVEAKDPDLDCGRGVRAGGHRAEEVGLGGEPLPDSTGLECYAVRENTHFTGTSSIRLREQFSRGRQPIESTRLLTGQQ